MRGAAWIAISLLCWAPVAAAQEVHGTVRDSVSHLPIPGAVVTAVDAGGSALVRDLTNAAGTYALDLPAGAVGLRVLRLGFHPQHVSLPATGSGPIDVTMVPLPSLLEKVTVNEAPSCPRFHDSEQAFGLWEQARAGLLASVTAREKRPGDMQILAYRRIYDHDRSHLIWQQVVRQASHTSRPFVPVLAAEQFARSGFAMLSPTGGMELTAPDADVLLDPSFATTHCFGIVQPDAAHAGEIGLGFVPAPGREHIVEVEGALWIDLARRAIRTLEFHYVHVSREDRDIGAGGVISFQSVSNGVVFIDGWSIVSAKWAPGGRRETEAAVAGGQVVSARWNDSTVWVANTGAIVGHVQAPPGADSSGVRVWLAGTNDSTTTDAAGHFEFYGLAPGPYEVDAAASPFDQAGLAMDIPPDSAVAVAGDSGTVVVGIDSLGGAARKICPEDHGRLTSAMLILRVRDADGWNLVDDSISVTWKRPPSHFLGMTIGHEGHFAARTDHNARVTLCDPPRGEPLQVVVGPTVRPQLTTTVTMSTKYPIQLVTLIAGGQPN